MTIKKSTATRAIQAGTARLAGTTYHDGATWQIVERLDLCRVDHYLLGHGDLR